MRRISVFAAAMLAAASALTLLAAAPTAAQTQVTISGSTDYGIPCPDTGTTFPAGWDLCDIEVDGVPEDGESQITIEVINVVEGGEDTTTTVTCHTTYRHCGHGGRVVAHLIWDWDADSRGTTGHWDIFVNLDVLDAAGVDKFKVTAGSTVFERNVPLPACDTGESPSVDNCATPTPEPVITPPPPDPVVVCSNCDVDTNGDGVNDAISYNLPTDHPNYAPWDPPLPPDSGLCIDANGNYVDMGAGVWADNNGNDADGNVGETWVSAGNTCN